jgi:hypothetical protein
VEFNKRSPNTTKQQELATWSPGGPLTKTGQSTRQSTDIVLNEIIVTDKEIKEIK